MNIHFITNPVVGGWSPLDVRLGGSEESYVAWATRLKKRGHNVTLFHNGTHTHFEGVDYRDRSEYPEYAKKEPGVAVNCNYPDLPTYEPTVYLNNLVDANKYNLKGFKAVIHPSEYSVATLAIDHDTQLIVPYGYDPQEIYPEEKIPKTVLYASSPDRGLSELARVWEEVVDEVPDAQLLITYDGRADIPNSMCLGSVDNDTMAELYRTSDIWVHPCLGNELFGISGVKAQVAGCWPVYYPAMALAETVKFGTKTDKDNLAKDLIAALKGHPEPPKVQFADWDESTRQLEAILLKYA